MTDHYTDSATRSIEARVTPALACQLWRLPDELLELISAQLDSKALFMLLKSSKRALWGLLKKRPDEPWRAAFEAHVLTRAQRSLQRQLDALDAGLGKLLLAFIREEKGLLAGGSVLQHIVGSPFEGSTLEVFILEKSPTRHCDFTVRGFLSEEASAQKIAAFQQRLKAKLGLQEPCSPLHGQYVELHDYLTIMPRLEMAHCLTIGALKVHFFHVQATHRNCGADRDACEDSLLSFETLEDFIQDQFDLDVCQCWSDGERVFSRCTLQQVLKRASVNQTSVRRAKASGYPIMNIRGMIRMTQERVESYKELGFKIMNEAEMLPMPAVSSGRRMRVTMRR